MLRAARPRTGGKVEAEFLEWESGAAGPRMGLTPCAEAGGWVTLDSRDLALLDLVEQGLVADAENHGGLAAVPVDLTQRLLDRRALGLHRGRFGHLRERPVAFLGGRLRFVGCFERLGPG